MSRDRNIFARVVTTERQTTELLCNLLAFDRFRRCFLPLLVKDRNIGDVQYEDIDTETPLLDCGRPDIRVSNNEFLVFVEAKTWDSHPTPNQPDGYLRHLADAPAAIKKWLVFLTPANYVYLGQIQAALRTAPPGIQHRIVTWESVLIELNKLYTWDKSDSGAACVQDTIVRDFIALLKGWFMPSLPCFDDAEIRVMFDNRNTPRAILALHKLIDGVRDRLGQTMTIGQSRVTGEYGLYFRDAEGSNLMWFGVWYPFWEQSGCPLSFGVHNSWRTAKAFKEQHRDAERCEEYAVVRLPKDKMPAKGNEADQFGALCEFLSQKVEGLRKE